MARVNVSYIKCNCDICGKEECISQSLILPKGWNKIKMNSFELDLCEECNDKIKCYIETLKNKQMLCRSMDEE